MKKFALLLLGLGLALGQAVHAQSYKTTTLIAGGTNNIAATVTNQAYGPIQCVQSDNVALWLSQRFDDTAAVGLQWVTYDVYFSLDNTGTNINFLGLADANTNQINANIKLNVAGNEASWVGLCTNLSVGAVPYLWLKITNTNAAAVTNLTVKYGTIRGL